MGELLQQISEIAGHTANRVDQIVNMPPPSDGYVSRRQFVVGAGALAVSALLSACGVSQTPEPIPSQPQNHDNQIKTMPLENGEEDVTGKVTKHVEFPTTNPNTTPRPRKLYIIDDYNEQNAYILIRREGDRYYVEAINGRQTGLSVESTVVRIIMRPGIRKDNENNFQEMYNQIHQRVNGILSQPPTR